MKNEKYGKMIFLVALFGIMLMLSSVCVLAQLRDFPAPIVVLQRNDPNPALPGDYVDVWINIINYATRDMDNFRFSLKPEFPFYIDPSETSERELGTLKAGAQATLHYKVRVEENAVEGISLLRYSYRHGGIASLQEGDLNILIQTIDANLAISDITVSPEKIEPNKASLVSFKLKNLADSLLRDITIKLDLSSTLIPLVPVGSSNEKKVYSIKAGQEASVDFSIAALSDATAQIYKVPIMITYYDELGKEYTKSQIVGLMVGSEPEIGAMIESSDIVKKGAVGTLNIKIVNKGATDIKYLTASLAESENFDMVSTSENYIGKIDSDDYENTEFKIVAKRSKEGKVELPLKLDYKDANNQDYSQDILLSLDLKASKLSQPKKGGAGTLIFAIILIVGGYFAYRKWVKKKKKLQ